VLIELGCQRPDNIYFGEPWGYYKLCMLFHVVVVIDSENVNVLRESIYFAAVMKHITYKKGYLQASRPSK
jgi:hypothetical protein